MPDLQQETPEKKKRVMSDEQKRKMQEGRQNSKKNKINASIAPSVIISHEPINIFGEVDRNRDGKIKSDYPAWYFESQRDELEESVRHRKHQLDNDLVPLSERGIQRERLKQEEERLEKIINSKPDIQGKPAEDVIAEAVSEIGAKISKAMFSRSDMQRGTADAHEEAKRISTPIIEVKSDKEAELYKACGIKISDNGRVDRSQAEKVWKIGRKILGESTNTEILRKG